MARIVLGIGTSHTPMLSLPAEHWAEYAAGDRTNRELVFPPDGLALPYEEAVATGALPGAAERPRGVEVFAKQAKACVAALDVLAASLRKAQPDITVVVSDDQDEWFYDDNMPALSVYWGESVPLVPREGGGRARSPEIMKAVADGYGDRYLDVPVPAAFGRHVIESLIEQDFDVAQLRYPREEYGGTVVHRYPTRDGELEVVRETPERRQGLPHGFSFVVKRLMDNNPGPLLPIVQNTCYPPNAVTPRRCYQVGQALARAIDAWPDDVRVAVVASGGLSHFVVDEQLDRTLLDALAAKDAAALSSLPRNRLRSGTSESLNWVTVAGALANTNLGMQLVDYVPTYRTEAGTGGGWAFAQWQ